MNTLYDLIAIAAAVQPPRIVHELACDACLEGQRCEVAAELNEIDRLVSTDDGKALVMRIVTFLEQDEQLEGSGQNIATAARVLVRFRDEPALRFFDKQDGKI